MLPPAQCGPATDKPGRFRSALACLHELQTRLKDKSWTVDPGPSRCDQICCLGYAEVILCNDNNDAAITFSAVWLGQMVEAILDQCYGKNVEQGTIRGQQWGMVNVGGGEVSMSKEHNANIIVRHAETCPFFLGSLNPYLIEDYLDLDEYPKFDKAVVQVCTRPNSYMAELIVVVSTKMRHTDTKWTIERCQVMYSRAQRSQW